MKELDFINGLKFSREAIANLLGIPLQLFGSQEKSSYNNLFEARQTFHTDTCIPFMNKFLHFLTRHIFYKAGILPENQYLTVDIDKTDVANELRMQKMEKYEKLHFLSVNEKRELSGLEPVKELNADTLLIPSGLTPIEELGMGDDIDDMEGEEGEEDEEGEEGESEGENEEEEEEDGDNAA